MHEFCSIFIRNTVKQGRSLARIQTKFNMSGQRVRCLLKGIKRFSQSVWFFAVLKRRKTPVIRRISNNDFVFQQDGAPAHHTVAYLHSHVPEFIEPKN